MYNVCIPVCHMYSLLLYQLGKSTQKGWTALGAGRTDVFLPAPLDLADFPEVLTSRYLTGSWHADGIQMATVSIGKHYMIYTYTYTYIYIHMKLLP